MTKDDINDKCANLMMISPFNYELFTGRRFSPSNTTSVHS